MPQPSAARQAALQRAVKLQAFLEQEFSHLPEPGKLVFALLEDVQALQPQALAPVLDGLKAEVLAMGRAAERHAFNRDTARPRGFRSPRVPAVFQRFLTPADPALPVSDVSLEHLEGTVFVLELASALFVHESGSAALAVGAVTAPLLLTDAGQPLALVCAPDGMPRKQAQGLAMRLAKSVKKLDEGTLLPWAYRAELVRHGFALLVHPVETFDVGDDAA